MPGQWHFTERCLLSTQVSYTWIVSFSGNQRAPLEPGSWQLGTMEEAGDAGVCPEEYHENKGITSFCWVLPELASVKVRLHHHPS